MPLKAWETPLALPDAEAAMHLGERIAAQLQPGDVLALSGDLGAGKTTLARAVIQSLTGRDDPVPSPTFTLLQQYSSPRGMIWHYDWYRLKNPEEIFELGFEDALAGGIILIEWPERAAAYVPETAVWCRIRMNEDGERIVTCSGGEKQAANPGIRP